MSIGLIGRKVGMTQVFQDDGTMIPVSVLAIEPMVTLGSPEVGVLADAWTVVTLDGSCAAHWEHSVAITEDGPWVLTALDEVRL